MGRLLSARQAAKRAGIGVDRFRAICSRGLGPATFNPLPEGRPMFVDTVVDRWLEERDDRHHTDRVAS